MVDGSSVSPQTKQVGEVFQPAWLLSLLGGVLCVMGCFFPWFEYRTVWHPQKVLGQMELATNPVYERRGVLGFGPDLYLRLGLLRIGDKTTSAKSVICKRDIVQVIKSPILSDTRGCYVAGMCGNSSAPVWPNRLHTSNLTDSQVLQVRGMRAIGLLTFVIGLATGGIGLARLVRYAWHRYGPLWVVIVSVLILGMLVYAGLQALGVIIIDIFVFKEQPPGWLCQRTPPPERECPTLMGSPYTLPDGNVYWGLDRMLPTGPCLVIAGLVACSTGGYLRRWTEKRNGGPHR